MPTIFTSNREISLNKNHGQSQEFQARYDPEFFPLAR